MSYFNCLKEIIITNSYGIVAFTKKNNQYYYLMIQRNNTFGYIDIIKGKYDQGNRLMMKNLINNMTTDEKKSIQTESFKTLWNTMWTVCRSRKYCASFSHRPCPSARTKRLLCSLPLLCGSAKYTVSTISTPTFSPASTTKVRKVVWLKSDGSLAPFAICSSVGRDCTIQ